MLVCLGFESMADLAGQIEISYGTVADSAIEMFYSSHQDHMYHTAYTYMKQYGTNVQTTQEGIQRVIKGYGKTKGKQLFIRCLKTVYQKDWVTHTNDLHKEMNVLKVENIFKHSMVQLIYKQRYNLLPDLFDSYFKPKNEIHNLQTRNAHKLNVIRVKNQLW